MNTTALRFLLCLLFIVPAWAQLAPPNKAGVTMGHVHLAVKDVDAHKAFWTNIMGGKLVKNGPLELVEFPGVYILFRQSNEATPPEGAILNHFGFVVKDMPGALAKWKANNLKVTPTENPNENFVWAPDGIRIEVFGVPDLATPIEMNHLHFYASDVSGMQAWYMRILGAIPGKRFSVASVSKPRMIETVDVPGVNFSFSESKERLAPTKGRSLDHIGFEVKNLETHVKNLEANGIKFDEPVHQVPNSNIKVAFLTDPWGTRVELTENLAPAHH